MFCQYVRDLIYWFLPLVDVERYLGKRLPSVATQSFTKSGISGGLLNSIVYDRDHDALKELGVAKALDRHAPHHQQYTELDSP